MGKIAVGFAFGGQAVEHDHSVKSALYLMAHIDRATYDCTSLYVAPDGRFAGYDGTVAKFTEVLSDRSHPLFSPNDEVPEDFLGWLIETVAKEGPTAAQLLDEARVDIIFPVFHGQHGEDSIFQGFLEFTQLPYVGCGITGSVVGNDKELNKQICEANGISVADYISIESEIWSDTADTCVSAVEDRIGYPNFIKPPRLGSSVGITKAYDRGQLRSGIDLALSLGPKALIEKPVVGIEYGVGLIGNGVLEAGAIVEFGVGPDYLNYDAKYGPEASVDTIPAVLEPAVAELLVDTARTVFRALDLCGMSRIDFFVSGENIIFNEANTVPGFGRNSVFSKLWEANGVPITTLIDRLIKLGFERSRSRSDLTFDPY